MGRQKNQGSTLRKRQLPMLKKKLTPLEAELLAQVNDNLVGESDSGSSEIGSDEKEDEYGDMHRIVLQGLLQAGWMNSKGVKNLFQKACDHLKCTIPKEEHLSLEYIQRIVKQINQKILKYDMLIKSATCEITGEKSYIFLITIEKQILRTQTYFPEPELQLFQHTMHAILQSETFAISETEFVDSADELGYRRFTKEAAQNFLLKLIGMKYMTKVQKNGKDTDNVTLGIRTIREFEPIYLSHVGYAPLFAKCCLCNGILLNGRVCPLCREVYHSNCLTKYSNNCKRCVTCKRKWTMDVLEFEARKRDFELPEWWLRRGEPQLESEPETGPSGNSTQEPQPGPSYANGSLTQGYQLVSDEGDDYDDMPTLEPVLPQSRRAKRNARRRMGKTNERQTGRLDNSEVEPVHSGISATPQPRYSRQSPQPKRIFKRPPSRNRYSKEALPHEQSELSQWRPRIEASGASEENPKPGPSRASSVSPKPGPSCLSLQARKSRSLERDRKPRLSSSSKSHVPHFSVIAKQLQRATQKRRPKSKTTSFGGTSEIVSSTAGSRQPPVSEQEPPNLEPVQKMAEKIVNVKCANINTNETTTISTLPPPSISIITIVSASSAIEDVEATPLPTSHETIDQKNEESKSSEDATKCDKMLSSSKIP